MSIPFLIKSILLDVIFFLDAAKNALFTFASKLPVKEMLVDIITLPYLCLGMNQEFQSILHTLGTILHQQGYVDNVVAVLPFGKTFHTSGG
tara:strand:- start:463 stop:735 length:273 start_codon:yes stop_codon:yes gene_type:complete